MFKKAQVADTVSWVIATIIIVVMLFLFILGSSLLSETKKITSYKGSIFSDKESNFYSNIYLSKSLYAYHNIQGTKNKLNFYESIHKSFSDDKLSDFVKRDNEIKKRLGA
jgi:hypothetical protein